MPEFLCLRFGDSCTRWHVENQEGDEVFVGIQPTCVKCMYVHVETGWKLHIFCNLLSYLFSKYVTNTNQRTIGPVNAHLISWPRKAQNIQNLEKYMVKK